MRGELRKFQTDLLRWYARHRRDLPWRPPMGSQQRVDPYRVLVSEAMLQQTQVATVVPYFLRFLERFPTVFDLARAGEQDVLRMWQGLGYYSRARHLHHAARYVVEQLNGEIPATVEALRALPGVGRYTAGAVASIAYGCRAPIVDGNVARVLCRLDCIQTNPREKATLDKLWRRAEEILPRKHCGDFNSALMEWGATVCTPRSPKCLICPVRAHCEAAARGLQEHIPPPKKAMVTPLLKRKVLCIRRGEAYLIEQRPAKGRWAGMWQFVTIDAAAKPSQLKLKLTKPKRIGEIRHALTHRRYEFDVYAADVTHDGVDPSPRVWVTLNQLDRYPLPRPHLRIAELLKAQLSPDR